MINVALNGFGRIGKQVVRIILSEKGYEDFNVVAINSPSGVEKHTLLFEYDSIYGKFPGTVESTADALIVNGKAIPFTRFKTPEEIDWAKIGADIIIDASGKFTGREEAEKHMKSGAKKIIITSPAKNPDATIVMGVNDHEYDGSKHHIVSNASCTTNCLAPVVKALHQYAGIVKGTMTTVHAYTGDQQIIDKPHKDARRARNASMSIIPTTTGAAKAIAEVMPQMKGKLDGFALRVPTPTVSLVDLVCEVEKPVTKEALNAELKRASEQELKGYLDVSDKPLVSVDYTKSPYSSIVDSLSTLVLQDNLVKIVAWYDNEYGYSKRVVDLARLMGKNL